MELKGTINMASIPKHPQSNINVKIDMSALQVFAGKLQGQLILPDDREYEQARKVWNGMIDRYPAIIARCETVSDVVASVNFARNHDLLIAVRGGGHNVAGHATNDGGI